MPKPQVETEVDSLPVHSSKTAGTGILSLENNLLASVTEDAIKYLERNRASANPVPT